MPTTTATDQRSYAKGSASLELSGSPAGQLVAIAGGDATADVVREMLGSDPVVHKHLGTVRYTDIELECSAVMERIFLDWIQDTLIHKFVTKNGAISFVDYDDEERSRLEFSNALLTSVGFPALDASAKDARDDDGETLT